MAFLAARKVSNSPLQEPHPRVALMRIVDLQKAQIPAVADAYFQLTSMHEGQFLPHSMAYLDAEKLKQSLVNPAS